MAKRYHKVLSGLLAAIMATSAAGIAASAAVIDDSTSGAGTLAKYYSTNANENTAISEIDISEGCSPAGINDAIRQLMADIKTDSEGNRLSLVYLGAVATTSALPAGGAAENAFYYVTASDGEYIYEDSAWTAMPQEWKAHVISASEEPVDQDELDALFSRLCDGGFVIFGEV